MLWDLFKLLAAQTKTGHRPGFPIYTNLYKIPDNLSFDFDLWILFPVTSRSSLQVGRMTDAQSSHAQLEKPLMELLSRVIKRQRTTLLEPPVPVELVQKDLEKFRDYSSLQIDQAARSCVYRISVYSVVFYLLTFSECNWWEYSSAWVRDWKRNWWVVWIYNGIRLWFLRHTTDIFWE